MDCLLKLDAYDADGHALAAVALLLLAAPLTAEAQPAGKVHRIGYLAGGSSTSTAAPHVIEAFRQGLRELGWVEGQNIVIDYRFAEYKYDRLPDLAAELVRLKVDIIVAPATPAAAAAKNATGTVPIVMIGGQPRPPKASFLPHPPTPPRDFSWLLRTSGERRGEEAEHQNEQEEEP